MFGLFKKKETVIVGKSQPAQSPALVKKNKVKIPKGSDSYRVHQSMKATLGAGSKLRDAVRLPKGYDRGRWIATQTVEMYNIVMACHGLISDNCTEKSCPLFKAGLPGGQVFDYHWSDGPKDKPVPLSAPAYIDRLAGWATEMFNDTKIFTFDGEVPKECVSACKKILTRLFRIYAHIYSLHWEHAKATESHEHVNTCFKHFMYFVREFQLVEEKEFQVLGKLITEVVGKD
eukprot:TRINITY_DN2572_c0_g1_i1.p1 TRINITY_DN2572_c0_g1~~TRINITY_DN2572_c0_g1_i1.p1  ORF type:complete len:231 (+),score=34.38 TRINITY_DN2572_c0_g1_i1:3-695(+)